jgi:4-hydroxy-tetrahydrodipicolinate synthase
MTVGKPLFRGSGVALVTPFDDGGVNEAALRALVRFQIDAGTSALIVCGSTGEAATMLPEEQRTAVEVVVAEAAGAVPVVAGCGGSDTAAVARLARSARLAGADAVLLSAPPYNKPPQRGYWRISARCWTRGTCRRSCTTCRAGRAWGSAWRRWRSWRRTSGWWG